MKTITVTAMMMAAFALNAAAQSESMLTGIDAFGVKMIVRNSAAPGLPDLRADVELRMRTYNVKPRAGEELPYLEVSIATIAGPSQSAIFSITLSFMQTVSPESNPGVKGPAATWHQTSYGIAAAKDTKIIREGVLTLLDQFLSTYLRARDSKQ